MSRFVDQSRLPALPVAKFQPKSSNVKQRPGPDWRPIFFLVLGLLFLLLALAFCFSLYL